MSFGVSSVTSAAGTSAVHTVNASQTSAPNAADGEPREAPADRFTRDTAGSGSTDYGKAVLACNAPAATGPARVAACAVDHAAAAAAPQPAAQSGWLAEAATVVQGAGNFVKGFGEGVWDGGAGMVRGVGTLAQGAVNLATSSQARDRAREAVGADVHAALGFVETAVSDPAKAAAQVGGAVTTAWQHAAAAYDEAKAHGHAAQFLGQVAGQGAVLVGTAIVPGGAEADGIAAVGDAGRVTGIAEAASKTGAVADDLANTGQGAVKLERSGQSALDAAQPGQATDELATTGDLAKSEAARPTPAAPEAITQPDAATQALRAGRKLSGGHPPVELDHVFQGEVGSRRGTDAAKGFHHAAADGVHPDARVVHELTPRNAQGVYQAQVEITKPGTTTTLRKMSTMFPDTMTRDDIVKALQHAYDNATQRSGNSFSGPSGHGFDIQGYTSGSGQNLHIRTGFPIYTP